MTNFIRPAPNLLTHLYKIDIEDLDYIERDLCFHELVSLGFLLFAGERTTAEFLLQKLLVEANSVANNSMVHNVGLLRRYASVNSSCWREYLVEALAIIGARRVLRKLGFQWESLRQHYLPHIAELSLHIHPMQKALYKMCERLTTVQAGRLVLQINEQCKRVDEHLRFYIFDYLEIFLLDWITRRIISVGDDRFNGTDVEVLLEYFKFNELDALKSLLLETINVNIERKCSSKNQADICSTSNSNHNDNSNSKDSENTCHTAALDTNNLQRDRLLSSADIACDLDVNEYYSVEKDTAGLVLIINQKTFHKETDESFKHLLPAKALKPRLGTDVDKDNLKKVFSSFGYVSIVYEDVCHIKLLEYIRETVKRAIIFDSLIVCVLSHGSDGVVYGANSIPVEISEIEQIITKDTLRGKPKMLILQACQKDETHTNNGITKEKKRSAVRAPEAVHDCADMIKAMSTVPGFISLRHTEDGSWFIQTLCKTLEAFGDIKHMADILTIVTREVVKKRGNKDEVMLPMTSSTLTKLFRLPQRKR